MSTAEDTLHAEEMVEAATLLDNETRQVETDHEPPPNGHVESLLLAAEATRHVAELLRVASGHLPEYDEAGTWAYGCTYCGGADGRGPCGIWLAAKQAAHAVLEGYT